MELLYRFVPRLRKLDNYEETFKDCVCIIIDQDSFSSIVEFEDGTKISLPTVELIEIKFGTKNVWVY